MALASVELGLAMPSNEGFIAWVKKAFGPGVAFCVSLGCWFNDIVNKIKPGSLVHSVHSDFHLHYRSTMQFIQV